jgi:hypothetical protein
MRRVIALFTLAVAAMLVAAGCGGGDSKPLTKAEYEQQMRVIGENLSKSLNTLGSATTAKGAATALEKVQGDMEKGAADMKAITPPEDIETQHEQLVEGVETFGTQLEPVITKLEKGDLQALAEVTSLTALTEIQNASQALNEKGYDIASG